MLLHQDPRYFYKGSGSIPSRALYALANAVICKGDNHRWQPNYSSIIGGIAANVILGRRRRIPAFAFTSN